MGRSLIIMLARMVSSPAQPSENVDVTAVGKDPLWKIARRTALVADVKGKHALKISEGAGMGLVQNGISVPLTFLCATSTSEPTWLGAIVKQRLKRQSAAKRKIDYEGTRCAVLPLRCPDKPRQISCDAIPRRLKTPSVLDT